MRKLLITALITFAAATAEAQGLGYVEGGLAGVDGFPGTWSDSFHVAGGGEVVAADRVGFGGELGFFNRLVTASGNGTLYLTPLSKGIAGAFVSGGYSRFGIGDGEGGFNAWNVGIGAHVWFTPRTGLRLQFRDHIRPDDRGTTQYWSIRAGVAFR